MTAFHNNTSLKDKCLNLILEHGFLKGINNDHLPRYYGEDGPSIYETELGIPAWLAYTDIDFENYLPKPLSKSWKYDYLNAIHVGADLSKVSSLFNLWLLADPIHGEWKYFTDSNRHIGNKIITLYSNELYNPSNLIKSINHDAIHYTLEWHKTEVSARESADTDNKAFLVWAAHRSSSIWALHTEWTYDKSKSTLENESLICAMRKCLLSLLTHAPITQ